MCFNFGKVFVSENKFTPNNSRNTVNSLVIIYSFVIASCATSSCEVRVLTVVECSEVVLGNDMPLVRYA